MNAMNPQVRPGSEMLYVTERSCVKSGIQITVYPQESGSAEEVSAALCPVVVRQEFLYIHRVDLNLHEQHQSCIPSIQNSDPCTCENKTGKTTLYAAGASVALHAHLASSLVLNQNTGPSNSARPPSTSLTRSRARLAPSRPHRRELLPASALQEPHPSAPTRLRRIPQPTLVRLKVGLRPTPTPPRAFDQKGSSRATRTCQPSRWPVRGERTSRRARTPARGVAGRMAFLDYAGSAGSYAFSAGTSRALGARLALVRPGDPCATRQRTDPPRLRSATAFVFRPDASSSRVPAGLSKSTRRQGAILSNAGSSSSSSSSDSSSPTSSPPTDDDSSSFSAEGKPEGEIMCDSINQEEDLYRILGITKLAKVEDVRRAFLGRSRVCHPE